MAKIKKEKPLTLSQLTGELSKYSHEVLFHYMEEKFIGKEYFDEFKDKNLKGQDEILEKLTKLLSEKTIGDAQEKRKGDVLKIHNGALKRNKILSSEETLQIDQIGVF